MRELLLTTVATQLQRTDTTPLFIPVIFSILRIWDVVGNIITLYAPVHNTPTAVSHVIRLLAVSVLMS